MNLNINLTNYEYIFTGIHFPQRALFWKPHENTFECLMLQELKQIYSYSSWIVYEKNMSANFFSCLNVVARHYSLYMYCFTYWVRTIAQSMRCQAGGQRSEVRGQGSERESEEEAAEDGRRSASKTGHAFTSIPWTEEVLHHISRTSSDAWNSLFANAAFCRSVAILKKKVKPDLWPLTLLSMFNLC